MIRLPLTIALLLMPTLLAAQAVAVDPDSEPAMGDERRPVAAPVQPSEAAALPTRPRSVRYSPVKIRLQDGTPAPLYVAATGAGAR